jgi:hypothetical protein
VGVSNKRVNPLDFLINGFLELAVGFFLVRDNLSQVSEPNEVYKRRWRRSQP